MSYIVRHCRTPISYNVAFEEEFSSLKDILVVERDEVVFAAQPARLRGNAHVLKVWEEKADGGRLILMEDRQFNGHWISNTLKQMLHPKVEDEYAD